MFTARPSNPVGMDATITSQVFYDSLRDLVPVSTGHAYYNVVRGNPTGAATIATKAKWTNKILKWVAGGADFVGAVAQGTERGMATITAWTKWIDDNISPQILMTAEMMEHFNRAFRLYQIYRELEVMSRSWSGALIKFDLLDVIPSFDPLNPGGADGDTPGWGLNVGLRYANKESKGNVLSASGLDNPFIGKWDRPLFSYKGPTRFTDIEFDIQATPYSGVGGGDNAAIRIGESALELLDRVWYEGLLGRHKANRGVYFSPAHHERRSPKLMKEEARTISSHRLRQIDEEMALLQELTGKSRSEILAGTEAEREYWTDFPDRVHDTQVARIERLRNETLTTNEVIIQMESAERLQNTSDPEGIGFLDGVFNTVKQLGQAWGDLKSSATGNEAEGENTGPRMVFKANVAYAQATHRAYEEAKAIRQILYDRMRVNAQNTASVALGRMLTEKKKMEGATKQVEKAAADFNNIHGERLLDLLDEVFGEGLAEFVISDIHTKIEEMRKQKP
jgi:hypothetical protein